MRSSGVPINKLYNPKTREQFFPGFTWKGLHRTARSVAETVTAIHAKGNVIGNWDEKNIFVQSTGLVTLVNIDSSRDSVGKPEYLAPEFQGKPPSKIELTEKHDCFALAVVIFRLLMEGTHPFEGSGEPPELAKRIRQGLFPYSLTGNASVQPPALSVPFDVLHPEIQQLFHACFVEGHFHANRRPQAADWVNALQQAELELVQCAANQRHFYVQTQFQCPWCEITQNIEKITPQSEERQPPEIQEQDSYSKIPIPSTKEPTVVSPAQKPPRKGFFLTRYLSGPVAFWLMLWVSIMLVGLSVRFFQFLSQWKPNSKLKSDIQKAFTLEIPIFEDNFTDNRNRWFEDDGNQIFLKVENGKYIFESKRDNTWWLSWPENPLQIDQNRNFRIDAVIKQIYNKKDPRANVYGIIWGMGDRYGGRRRNYYFFTISDKGAFTYGKKAKGALENVIGWQESVWINQGNSTNTLTVEKLGEQLQFFINDHYIDKAESEPFFGDYIGFIINGLVKVEIDKITIIQATPMSEIIQEDKGQSK